MSDIGVNIMKSKPTEEELRDMLEKGMSLYKISRCYGVTVKEVHNWLVEYDMRLSYAKISLSKEDLKSMYIDEHMTQKQIAQELGYISKTPVYNMMDYYHIPTRGRGKYTPHQRSLLHDNIVKMYEDGMTTYEIAEKVGYSAAYVSRILQERGVQTRGRGRFTPQQRSLLYDKIEQMYNDGMTQEEIAKDVGYDQGYVGLILQRRGVQTRGSAGTITRKKMSLITAGKLQECIDKGMNQHQIAEYFGVHDATIYKLAERLSIPGMVSNYRCTTPKYIAWRDEVFARDNYTCQLCGKTGVRLEAHHIYPFRDYPDRQFDIDNGITLCSGCHYKVTYHESEYIVELEDIVLRDRHIGD